MAEGNLSVRQCEIEDFEWIIDYFLESDADFLQKMGVDIARLPSKKEWLEILLSDFYLEPEYKKFYYVVWLLNNKAIGHSNINKIIFGEEAYMHLHVWHETGRKKGMGHTLLQKTLPWYFNLFHLKTLFCEPSASNAAPNKTLEKLGFDFIKSYDTVPGWINLYQTVNRWCMTEEKFRAIYRDEYI